MSGQHTSGPWIAEEQIKGYRQISAPEGNWWHLARVIVKVSGKPCEDGEANARLIAAAPELLAMLERAVEIIDGEWPDPWNEAHALIAKARGQS